MSGMIPHHAQAVVMAGWAPTHGARKDVAILCERIVVGQRDEIAMMQTWLRDRGLPVPDATSTRHKMKMNGVEHDMLMPGMLTDEEMAALDRARGPEFDRLFLIGMIKHHQGAIDMVDVLFKSYGAAQDETVFKFASDVYADQSIEIDRMHKMLEEGSPHSYEVHRDDRTVVGRTSDRAIDRRPVRGRPARVRRRRRARARLRHRRRPRPRRARRPQRRRQRHRRRRPRRAAAPTTAAAAARAGGQPADAANGAAAGGGRGTSAAATAARHRP